MKPPGGECHDLFGASFSGTPSHLRVLKPPGGGSSDIFGVSGGEQTTSEPRRNKIHQSSNLFLGDDDASSTTSSKASNKPGNDSYQRLFGEVEIPKTPSAKNRMKSNIILDTVDSGIVNNNKSNNNITNGNITPMSKSSTSSINGNSMREGSGKALHSTRNPVTGDGYGYVPVRRINSVRRKDGNPVTGEGYDMPLSKPQTPNQQLTNGGSTSSVPNASSNNSAQTPAASAPSRQRVPPGGFSSGLW